MKSKVNPQPAWLNVIEGSIFASRWIQAPMYIGLIVAELAYMFKFIVELAHLILNVSSMHETEVLLAVLGLIDVVMVANLMFMVIIGGYETFVSRLYLDNHPDNPEWLSHVDAGMLKIKLGLSLVTISSIHLLKTFINAENVPMNTVIIQLSIHGMFVMSAVALTWTDKMMKSHVSKEAS